MTVVDEPRHQLKGWQLTDLLPDVSEPALASSLEALRDSVESFASRRERLDTIEPSELTEWLGAYESLLETSSRLAGYASLWFSQNTLEPRALAMRNRVERELTAVRNRLLFFTLWWKGLDEERVRELLGAGELTDDQRFYLEELRRLRTFTLDEAHEKIVNLKDSDGMRALMTLYSMLTNRLQFELEVDGEERLLTRDEINSYAFSRDAALRAEAYREMYRVYADESPVLGQIYVHRVRDWYNENVELRGYPSAIAVRNLANDIPDAAIEALLAAVRDRAEIFRRYFRLKAGWLGLDRLRRYDLYASLADAESRIEFDDAVALVLETFESFDPRFAEMAHRIFREGHIDSEVRRGKRGGAFCASVLPSLTPWVLVNYTGRMRDVATLAHELGHAIHSMLAEDHSILTYHPSLPLAETASVFAELLVTERLLAAKKEPLARRELLAAAMDDMYATVCRQSFFVLFEIEAHAAVQRNVAVDGLNELYLENLAQQFGDSVGVSDEFRHEWVSVPHFFATPFYCYAYAFGQLLVLALYRRFQQDPEDFLPRYRRLLAHGGSCRPAEILAEVDIDVEDVAFWNDGLDVVDEMVDRLEGIDRSMGD